MTRFVVLRDLRPADVPERVTRRARATATFLNEPEMRTVSADITAQGEIAGDLRAAVVTPVIATRLIAPTAAREGAGGDAAWGLDAIGALGTMQTGVGVTVAVLDTGIAADHPAFDHVDIAQKDFTGTGDGDRHGHGTHCAGTVFGGEIDGRRIGVAPGISRALIGKVLDDEGSGTSEALLEGMMWALTEGAQVISMSLGFNFAAEVEYEVEQGWPVDIATSHALEKYRGNLRMFDAIMDVARAMESAGRGCVVVAAAGNDSRRDVRPDFVVDVSTPAAAEDVVSVGAARRDPDELRIAPFSNANPVVSGPGVDVFSAAPGGGSAVMSGTSMACPHVAGAAALWWEAAPVAGFPGKAQFVAAQLMARAKPNAFAKDVPQRDRGAGLVKAP